MERKEVKSSNIAAIGYDPNSNILEVEFGQYGPNELSNRIYHYEGVPQSIYELFLIDESPGRFLYYDIRGIYPHKFIGILENIENSK